MKQGVGVVLFIGSFLVYPLVGYIALNSGLSLGEKATYTSIAYAVSWTSFFIGFSGISKIFDMGLITYSN